MTRRINEATTKKARSLRREMTDAERLLWFSLRNQQLQELRFRRQHPIGKYIADFACMEKHLVIEIDGGQHQEQTDYDQKRTDFLQSQGWSVLRFWNNEIFENLEAVLNSIALKVTTYPHPNPPPKKGRGKAVLSLKARALRYLSAREHSRAELAQKLARYAGEGDDVAALLDGLEAAKYLSNERFSESLIHRRVSRFGNNRILHELQEHGIAGETLSTVKAQLAESEADRALEVLSRKFDAAPADANEKLKQMRFLQQRGFSHGAIQAAMRALKHRKQD